MSQIHTLQEFSSQEGKNLELGQAGYEILTTTGSLAQTTSEGEWVAFMVLDGDVTTSATLHEPEGDSAIITIPAFPIGVLAKGYWKQVIGVRKSGSTDPWTMIVYKG